MSPAAEHQPLLLGLDSYAQLPPDLSSHTVEELLSSQSHKPLRWYPRLVGWESRLLWLLSGASIIVSVFNYMLSFVTLTFTGQLGALELAGASIASLGMASAVQTVCGQAYGAKKYAALGVICQRAIILHLGAAIVLTFLYWYSGAALRAIGQSDSIAEQGQVFARGLILQLYAFAISCPMQRFLQAQNIVNPLAYIAVGVFLFHILLTWLVVYVLDYGLLGAALALSFSWWLLVIIQALYILFSPSCRQTWTGFSVNAFKGIWPYFKLTLASATMLCLEIWYSQGLVLISGLLPDPTISLDSISICMNYLNWDMQFMLGLAAAASVRVSNEIGAGHPKVARFSVVVVNTSSILISIVFTAVVLIFRVGLSKLFTSDSEVIEAVSSLTPLLAISVFLNGIQPILSGVAIGSGWQAVVAYVNLATYYVIGLPVGCVLGFKTSLGVAGIWWGMVLGVFLQTVTLFILTVRTNWDAEVTKAADRLKQSANEETLEQLVGSGTLAAVHRSPPSPSPSPFIWGSYSCSFFQIYTSSIRGLTFSTPKLKSISESSVCSSWDGELIMVNGDQEIFFVSVLHEKQMYRVHCEESSEESSEAESVYALKCHISHEVNHLHEGLKHGLKSELEKASPSLGRSAIYLKDSRINGLPRFLTIQFVRFFWKRESNQKAKILQKVDYPLELDVYDLCSDDIRKKLDAPRQGISMKTTEMQDTAQSFSSMAKEVLRSAENDRRLL
ncbi:hypothetical protein F0562_008077 [Nyssa sinensis]|uniref:Protein DETOXIFICATION n=1 Tax=Nyssa sinensis TaxID=561372 RepID=A0A5J5A7K1_9ASTE|nr:hypothetical protein F0562_008077 [Nyssa sinensis]